MTRKQIQSYDTIAINEYGVSGVVLMENAGRGVSLIVEKEVANREGTIAIVAGQGNNGGDGFVVARHLTNAGKKVCVYFLGKRDGLKGDAKVNFEIILKMGIDVVDMADEAAVEKLTGELKDKICIVDAIFGTGLDREVKGRYARAIEIINSSGRPVISVDIPSGLDCDSGYPLGCCVRANRTVTFAYIKRGIVVYPGAEYAGKVDIVDIGAPASAGEKAGFDGRIINIQQVREFFKPRLPDTHKNTYGHVVIIAGSRGKTGAALMAASAALRTGSGLVTIATREDSFDVIEMSKPVEAMAESFDILKPDDVLRVIEGGDAVAFGPGCGLEEEMDRILSVILDSCKVTVVVDADGLTLLSRNIERLKNTSCSVILTPHPGEMVRLTGGEKGEILKNKIPVVRQFATSYSVYLVLKGARTIVGTPEGDIFVNSTGNPGMASGGMGDVLTGIVVSLCGQGLSPVDAACCSVFIHGLAGDRAETTVGQRALTATDVIDSLSAVISDFENSWR